MVYFRTPHTSLTKKALTQTGFIRHDRMNVADNHHGSAGSDQLFRMPTFSIQNFIVYGSFIGKHWAGPGRHAIDDRMDPEGGLPAARHNRQ